MRRSLNRSRRKGITPIIATVLLLGITVAIGLTVYTQAQGLIKNAGDTGNFNKLRQTDISLGPVFDNSGEMELRVSNKGERAINTSKFTVYYGPPSWDPVSYTTIQSQTSWTKNGPNNCFTQGKVIQPGNHISCETGVKFPGALQSVEIMVEANNLDYSTSYTCTVQSSGKKSC